MTLLFIMMKTILMILTAVELILFKFAKFWSYFGAGNDFLDPSRVESIDKGSGFRLDTTTNR